MDLKELIIELYERFIDLEMTSYRIRNELDKTDSTHFWNNLFVTQVAAISRLIRKKHLEKETADTLSSIQQLKFEAYFLLANSSFYKKVFTNFVKIGKDFVEQDQIDPYAIFPVAKQMQEELLVQLINLYLLVRSPSKSLYEKN